MNTQITPPFSFTMSLYLAVFLLSLVFIMVILIMFFTRKRKEHKAKPILKLAPLTDHDIKSIKQRYIELLNKIEIDYSRASLSDRAAHNALSSTIRSFANDMTGSSFESLTLEDIKLTKYQNLSEIISLCYPREFSQVSGSSEFIQTVTKARNMVSQWR